MNVFNNVILARNRQLPDDDRMIETCRSIFKSFNINNLSVCTGWCTDQLSVHVTLHLSVHVTWHLSVHVTWHLSVHVAWHLSVHVTWHLSVHVTWHLSVHVTWHLSVHVTWHLSVHVTWHLSVYVHDLCQYMLRAICQYMLRGICQDILDGCCPTDNCYITNNTLLFNVTVTSDTYFCWPWLRNVSVLPEDAHLRAEICSSVKMWTKWY